MPLKSLCGHLKNIYVGHVCLFILKVSHLLLHILYTSFTYAVVRELLSCLQRDNRGCESQWNVCSGEDSDLRQCGRLRVGSRSQVQPCHYPLAIGIILCILCSLFEEDISAINTMIQVVTPQPVRGKDMTYNLQLCHYELEIVTSIASLHSKALYSAFLHLRTYVKSCNP